MSEFKCPLCGEDVGQECASHMRCVKRSIVEARLSHDEILSEINELCSKLDYEYSEEFGDSDIHWDIYMGDDIVSKAQDFVDLLIFLRERNCEVESKPYKG